MGVSGRICGACDVSYTVRIFSVAGVWVLPLELARSGVCAISVSRELDEVGSNDHFAERWQRSGHGWAAADERGDACPERFMLPMVVHGGWRFGAPARGLSDSSRSGNYWRVSSQVEITATSQF